MTTLVFGGLPYRPLSLLLTVDNFSNSGSYHEDILCCTNSHDCCLDSFLGPSAPGFYSSHA